MKQKIANILTLVLLLGVPTLAHAGLFDPVFNPYLGGRVERVERNTEDRVSTSRDGSGIGVEAGLKIFTGTSVGLWVGTPGRGGFGYRFEARQGLLPLPFFSLYLTGGIGVATGEEPGELLRGGLGVSLEFSGVYGGLEAAATESGPEVALRVGMFW